MNYEMHFLMPYNIVFRYPDEVVKQMLTFAQKLSRKMAQDLAAGAIRKPPVNPIAMLVAFVFRIQRPLARFNGRLYKAGEACNLCQKCIKECRSGNIRLQDGQIRFGWNCAMCMRCVMFCPQGAVRAGWIDRLSVRGAYDFVRIAADPAIRDDSIQNCSKGFFKYFKKYIQKMEALLKT